MIVFLLACAGTASLDIVEVQLTVAEATPMVPVLSWEASEGAVEVVGPEASWVVSLGAPNSGVPILGLKPSTRYELVPVGVTAATQVFETPPAPDDLSGVQVELLGVSSLGDGGVMMAITTELASYVAVLDVDGDWVWWTPSDPGMTTASPRPLRDGSGILFPQHERDRVEDLSIVTRLSWDGRARDDVRTATGHHMATELPDGRLAFLGHTVESHLLEGVQGEVLTDTVVVDDEVLFDFFDTGPPYVPCSHASTPIDKFGWQGVFEWTHSNSLVHDDDAGLFYVVARHLDALLALDDTTGEVVWQLGGRDATRAFAADATPFDHPHTSWVTASDAWLFDNGVHAERPSRLVHYDLSVDPVVERWSYEPPEGRTVTFLGDVQPAPSDHVLGAWTVPGDVTEHDADGTVVWRAQLGVGPVLGRIRYVELPR